MQTSNTDKPPQKEEHLFPNDLFSLLDAKNKKMVIKSSRDAEQGFYVGKYLIEGTNNFPQNIEIGLKFIEDSMEKGSSDSLFYMCQLLTTKNNYIENNFDRAIQLLHSYYDKTDPRYNYIYGIIFRKRRNHKKAFKCFQRSLIGGSSEAYFNYAQMLFYGQGCTKDKDKANEYFKMAKLNGCTKCDKYLTKNRSILRREINSPYEKSADIVFLLDGTESMRRFIQFPTFSEYCNKLIYKLWDKFAKVYFRFGVVLYADTAVTSCFTKGKIEPVTVQFLTKRPSDIKRFLNNSVCYKGGNDGPEDWASGYKCLLDKIDWDENSEKIVIHIADAPAHGKSFNGNTFYSLPVFDKNFSKTKNQSIYDRIQVNEEEKFKKLIAKVASKGLVFFCINLNRCASNCFNLTRDIYMQNNGKKFVVLDNFDVLNLDAFESFAFDSVSSCLNKEPEINDDKKDDSKVENKVNDNYNIDDADIKSDSDFDYEYEVNKFFNEEDDDYDDEDLEHFLSTDEESDFQNDILNIELEMKKEQNKQIDNNNENKNNNNNDNNENKNNNNDNDKCESDFDYEYEVNKFFNEEDDEEFDHGFSDDSDSDFDYEEYKKTFTI